MCTGHMVAWRKWTAWPWCAWPSPVTVPGVCGIAGLFAKTSDTEAQVGTLLSSMLEHLADRGPDSSGAALYRRPVGPDATKLSLLAPATTDWAAFAAALEVAAGAARVIDAHDDHAVIEVHGPAADARRHVARIDPGVTVIGTGQVIELHKRTGRPAALIDRCGLVGQEATHALGHTRMATESRVTTAGSHPFSTGADLCIVHNGSLSNHNALRRTLRRAGQTFATANDSEVAAGYLTHRLAAGDALETALERALDDLDGFFTFAVGTRDGFAVLRDRIACKPAILAETDDWVAMASEYRAIADLPGAADAQVWEPEPGRIYSWTHQAALA